MPLLLCVWWWKKPGFTARYCQNWLPLRLQGLAVSLPALNSFGYKRFGKRVGQFLKNSGEGESVYAISCVWTRMPSCGRKEGEQIRVHCVGESTEERSWGFVTSQRLRSYLLSGKNRVVWVYLSTTYSCYTVRITDEVWCEIRSPLQLELVK